MRIGLEMGLTLTSDPLNPRKDPLKNPLKDPLKDPLEDPLEDPLKNPPPHQRVKWIKSD